MQVAFYQSVSAVVAQSLVNRPRYLHMDSTTIFASNSLWGHFQLQLAVSAPLVDTVIVASLALT